MADLELESRGNTAELRTWLIATPHNLGPDHLADFVGENILEVKPGTSLVNSPDSNFGGIFARGSRSGVGVLGHGTNNAGVHGRSTNGVGVWGHGDGAREGVLGDSRLFHGVVGVATGPTNAGVFGRNNTGHGVWGESSQFGFSAVLGQHVGLGTGVVGVGRGAENFGVHGVNNTGTGVSGVSESEAGIGVRGTTVSQGGGIGVLGIIGSPTQSLDRNVAVSARNNTGGWGVQSRTNTGIGVDSRSDSHIGVYGESSSSTGVQGFSSSGIGVRGGTAGGSATARAGVFSGHVDIGGNLVVYGTLNVDTGVKNFRIDHPLDPQNKYLLHTCVESSEMKNVYDGVVQLDEDGEAWVDLPEWFEDLNGDFRYQLTAVGGAAPNLHVAEEIYENHRFKIAGGQEGKKVCWQVTGTRKDPWAAANPFEVEQEKPQEDRGRYLQPELYDAPKEQMVMSAARATAPFSPAERSFEPPQAPEMPQGYDPQPPDVPPPQAPEMPRG